MSAEACHLNKHDWVENCGRTCSHTCCENVSTTCCPRLLVRLGSAWERSAAEAEAMGYSPPTPMPYLQACKVGGTQKEQCWDEDQTSKSEPGKAGGQDPVSLLTAWLDSCALLPRASTGQHAPEHDLQLVKMPSAQAPALPVPLVIPLRLQPSATTTLPRLAQTDPHTITLTGSGQR
jgi:hypothetical protein